ncbi:MAG: 50S ribosomal protein L10 [Bacillota bacterium]
MAVTAEKQATVAEIREKLEKAKGAVLADYRGLNVADATKLRRALREAGVEFRVLKNTMTRIAAQEAGIQGLDSYLEGPTAVAFGFTDLVAPAKVLCQFAKENKNLVIKAGIVEGKVVNGEGVKALADLPPKEVLIAKMLGSMQAPLAGLVNVLQGNIRNLVYTLEAVRKQKGA